MDAFLVIASKRDTRHYSDRPIPAEVQHRILDAGRLSGSARNTQLWRFIVVESEERRDQVADSVYAPPNVHGARLVVAIVAGAGLDAGRCAQNMMLAAWNDGVASCPNGIKDAEAAANALGLAEGEQVAIILSFGYPATGHDASSRTADEWSSRAERKSLDELVERI